MLRRLEAELKAAEIIRHAIWERTARNVRELRVVHSGDALILRGICKSYYTKQLAQQIAKELIEPSLELKNEIEVIDSIFI